MKWIWGFLDDWFWFEFYSFFLFKKEEREKWVKIFGFKFGGQTVKNTHRKPLIFSYMGRVVTGAPFQDSTFNSHFLFDHSTPYGSHAVFPINQSPHTLNFFFFLFWSLEKWANSTFLLSFLSFSFFLLVIF